MSPVVFMFAKNEVPIQVAPEPLTFPSTSMLTVLEASLQEPLTVKLAELFENDINDQEIQNLGKLLNNEESNIETKTVSQIELLYNKIISNPNLSIGNLKTNKNFPETIPQNFPKKYVVDCSTNKNFEKNPNRICTIVDKWDASPYTCNIDDIKNFPIINDPISRSELDYILFYTGIDKKEFKIYEEDLRG